MKPLAIVNPRAGSGRAGRTLPELRPILERALGEVDVVLTERVGHGIDLGREAAQSGRELVIAVGGDGTFSEVAGGILDAGGDATALAYVGQGTGGDFRRSLGIEHRLDRYLERIASGQERRVDAGRVTYTQPDGREASRWFVNVLSVGVGGLVDRFVADGSRALPGAMAYFAATIRAVAQSEPLAIRCTVHRGGVSEERVLPSYAIAIANGSWFGSGMRIAPDAVIDDGLFDVVAMTAPSKLAFLALGTKVYGGTHIGEPGVTTWRCDAIDLALADGPPGRRALLDIDGEALGVLPARVRITPGALRLRA